MINKKNNIFKIIITSLSLLTLTSCGTPKIENSEDALKQNQVSLIENLEKTIAYYPESGNSIWKIDLILDTKEGKLNIKTDYNSDYSNNWLESSSNFKINLKANAGKWIKIDIKDFSWNLDLDLIALKNKFLFKLNSLNIDNIEKNPQLAIVPGIVWQFQKKWYFMDLPTNKTYLSVKENLIKNYKNILSLLNTNILLEFVKENENKNFYDYDVKISEKAIINISSETKKLVFSEKEKQALTKEEITEIKKSVLEFNKNIKLNIQINKSNLNYFTLKIKSNQVKDWFISIENTNTNFNIKVNSIENKTDIQLIWNKSKNKIEWTLIAKIEEKELFNWIFSSSYNKWKSSFSIEWKAKNEWEELKIKLNINDSTTKKSVKIEEPKESKNFQEVIQWVMGAMMWWAFPTK